MDFILELVQRYPVLSCIQERFCLAHEKINFSLREGGTLFLCGNGGSAADCEHIAGELLKGFLSRRPLTSERKSALRKACVSDDTEYLVENLQSGIRALSLVSHPSLATAVSNDISSDLIFAQQLNALGRAGDVLLAISTSGRAKNVIMAAIVARSLGMTVIGLTGSGGGRLADYVDILIDVPEHETYKVQELHLPLYHALCAMLEKSVLQ